MVTTGITFGIFGYLVAVVLSAPGEALEWWHKLIKWLFRHPNDPDDFNALQWWSYKALMGCSKCVAGFYCLVFCVAQQYPPFDIFQTVIISIFTAFQIEKVNEYFG